VSSLALRRSPSFRPRLSSGSPSARSHAAGTPGGLFAPTLVLCAQFGFLFGAASKALLDLNIQPQGFAVVGMAAFFGGVVRAPITGLVPATEMTDSVSTLLPMLSAYATAMLTPALIGDPPIYESLRERSEPIEKCD
jgi:CIC family chloride channel protein